MNPKTTSDWNCDLEQQLLLRMPEDAARYLLEDLNVGIPFKDNFTIEMKSDMRNAVVRYNGQVYTGRLMDLPCIIESHKTMDRKTFYKTADISQILICSQSDDIGPIRGSAAYLSSRSQPSHANAMIKDTKELQYLHGITPPLKNVLRRRFRKTRKKRLVDMPQIEKEVKQLLRADMEAEGVKWEVIWSDPPRPAAEFSRAKSKPSGTEKDDADTSTGVNESGIQADVLNIAGKLHLGEADADDEDEDDDRRAYAINRLAVFGELSSCGSTSSSSSSDDGDDDEDGFDGSGKLSTKVKSGEKPFGDEHASIQSGKKAPTQPKLGDDVTKDELAAELLLSDSDNDSIASSAEEGLKAGVENDPNFAISTTTGTTATTDIAAVSLTDVVEDNHAAAGILDVLDDVDVSLVGVDDDDDEFQPGGELLDDPFGGNFSTEAHHLSGESHSEDDDDAAAVVVEDVDELIDDDELSRDNF